MHSNLLLCRTCLKAEVAKDLSCRLFKRTCPNSRLLNLTGRGVLRHGKLILSEQFVIFVRQLMIATHSIKNTARELECQEKVIREIIKHNGNNTFDIKTSTT